MTINSSGLSSITTDNGSLVLDNIRYQIHLYLYTIELSVDWRMASRSQENTSETRTTLSTSSD